MLSSHPSLALPLYVFPPVFPTKNFARIYYFLHVSYMPYPCHCPSFHHSNDSTWNVQNITFVTTYHSSHHHPYLLFLVKIVLLNFLLPNKTNLLFALNVTHQIFLISNFRSVLNVRNTLFHLHGWVGVKNEFIFHTYLPMKMEQRECSETSAYKIQTPGNYPEESLQRTKSCSRRKP